MSGEAYRAAMATWAVVSRLTDRPDLTSLADAAKSLADLAVAQAEVIDALRSEVERCS